MAGKIFTFIKPYLSYIDSGRLFRKPFGWLYTLLAMLNVLVPIDVLYRAFDNQIFDAPAKFVIAFLLVWVVITFACWVSFQLLWDRREKVLSTSPEGDEFIATPGFAHFIQTLGEWIGTWLGIAGTGVAIITTILLGDEGRYLIRQIDYDFLGSGLIFIILMPVYGFLIIVTSRYLAEQARALISIVHNTKNR